MPTYVLESPKTGNRYTVTSEVERARLQSRGYVLTEGGDARPAPQRGESRERPRRSPAASSTTSQDSGETPNSG